MRKKKKELIKAPEEHKFWACDGSVLSDVGELARCIEMMNNDQFKHHVNKEKNDFASWTNEILNDKKLATSLRKIKTKSATLKKIKAHIA